MGTKEERKGVFSGAAAELDAGTEIEMAPKGILCRELPVTTTLGHSHLQLRTSGPYRSCR
jgi:hypothetical protein